MLTCLRARPPWGIMCGMSRLDPTLRIRLPQELRSKVQLRAAASRRSMNAEIIAQLEQSYREEGHAVNELTRADLEKRLAELEHAVISIIFDQRFDKMDERLSALEKRLGEKSA